MVGVVLCLGCASRTGTSRDCNFVVVSLHAFRVTSSILAVLSAVCGVPAALSRVNHRNLVFATSAKQCSHTYYECTFYEKTAPEMAYTKRGRKVRSTTVAWLLRFTKATAAEM